MRTSIRRIAAGLLISTVVAAVLPAVARADEPVTFNKHIAPILFSQCAACHRDGEVAPFPLLSYDDAKQHAEQIVEVTGAKQMPPWPPVKGHGEFMDERRLTDGQIAVIKKWVEGGKARGEAKDLPAAPKFESGWLLGKPDLVLKMPEAYKVSAEGRDVFRCFVVPVEIPDTKYVRAFEFRPGNPAVVHHAIFYMDDSGQARGLDEKAEGPGYPGFGGPGFIPSGAIGGWAPGAMAREFPKGTARKLPKGTDVVMQVHYHPNGKAQTDQSTIALYFADKPPEKPLIGVVLGSFRIRIQPGDKAYKATDSYTVPADLSVVGITPHAHLICKDMKVTATLPDGKTVVPLIWINDWNFNWQGQYTYKTPVKLPKGSKIEMVYTYDNSADNPNNPSNPPKLVKRGEQTTDEMAFAFLQVIPDRNEDAITIVRTGRGRLGGILGGDNTDIAKQANDPLTDPRIRQALQEVIKRFDKDGDGKLSPQEQEEARKWWEEQRQKRANPGQNQDGN